MLPAVTDASPLFPLRVACAVAQDFTLQDLLDDDDILQECRQANKKLTEYLAEPDVIRTLLEYVVNEPSDDLNERQRFKYPNIASEVLTSECWPIMDAICQPDALELLWSTLDRPQPLNPLLASFFTKVIIMLLNKEVEMITKYLMDRPEITDKLISHLATPAIMDVILKMTTVETAGEAEEETSLNKVRPPACLPDRLTARPVRRCRLTAPAGPPAHGNVTAPNRVVFFPASPLAS